MGKRDHALHMRIDNLTSGEAGRLSRKFQEDKDRIAPEARGTLEKGKMSQLGGGIFRRMLGGGDDE